jgi:hypothetical protein
MLMGASMAEAQNARMPERDDRPETSRTATLRRIRELQEQVDERDEIIRQLNEALSIALHELAPDPELAA